MGGDWGVIRGWSARRILGGLANVAEELEGEGIGVATAAIRHERLGDRLLKGR